MMQLALRLHGIVITAFVVGILVTPLAYAQEELSVIAPLQPQAVLLRKTVDTSEVLPGASIRITLHVQNVLLSVINNAEVVERFDPSILTVVSANTAESTASGSLRWLLPRLGPGEVWEESFVLQVSPDATHETLISTIATIIGEDIQNASLQEMVAIVNVSVVEHLPSTGAPYDLLFLLTSLPLALSLSTVQHLGKRRIT